MSDEFVSVLIPAYNEEVYIYETVSALRRIPEIGEIIVIDDASADNTVKLATEAGASVISLAENVGKGGALNKGLEAVNGNIVALVDGDIGATAADVRKLVLPVINGHADMTIAKFPKARKKGGFGLVKGLARKGIKIMSGLEVSAPLSGQRVMKKAVIDAIGGFSSGYGVEVGMTIRAARMGFQIKEIEVNMTHAETGRDIKGFLHRGMQFKDVAKVLVMCFFKR